VTSVSKRILVVDDEEDVRAIVGLALEMTTDWELLFASSGREALTLAATSSPDAILLDMMMPDMDGRETLAFLKADPATAAIPVILVTAKARADERSIFPGSDVLAVLAKPFRPLELADQILELLGERKG
jgi:CheY-like chemotaxis protein